MLRSNAQRARRQNFFWPGREFSFDKPRNRSYGFAIPPNPHPPFLPFLRCATSGFRLPSGTGADHPAGGAPLRLMEGKILRVPLSPKRNRGISNELPRLCCLCFGLRNPAGEAESRGDWAKLSGRLIVGTVPKANGFAKLDQTFSWERAFQRAGILPRGVGDIIPSGWHWFCVKEVDLYEKGVAGFREILENRVGPS